MKNENDQGVDFLEWNQYYSFIYNESEIIMKEGLNMRVFTYDIKEDLYEEANEPRQLDKALHTQIHLFDLINSLNGLLYMRRYEKDLLVIKRDSL